MLFLPFLKFMAGKAAIYLGIPNVEAASDMAIMTQYIFARLRRLECMCISAMWHWKCAVFSMSHWQYYGNMHVFRQHLCVFETVYMLKSEHSRKKQKTSYPSVQKKHLIFDPITTISRWEVWAVYVLSQWRRENFKPTWRHTSRLPNPIRWGLGR